MLNESCGIGCGFLPPAATGHQIYALSQEVSARWILYKRGGQDFGQELFCLVVFPLCYQSTAGFPPFPQTLLILVSETFAPQAQRFAMDLLGFLPLAFACE